MRKKIIKHNFDLQYFALYAPLFDFIDDKNTLKSLVNLCCDLCMVCFVTRAPASQCYHSSFVTRLARSVTPAIFSTDPNISRLQLLSGSGSVA